MERISEIISRNRALLAERDREANKGSYGKVLVIAGSPGMAGAAYLASLGAFRTGIGMVKLYGPEENRCILQTLLPEAMYSTEDLKGSIGWADAVILGPGLSKSEAARKLIRSIYSEEIRAALAEKKLLVIDADALNLIAELGLSPGALSPAVVITPHIGEMSRLTGLSIAEIKKDPEAAAAQYRERHGCMVVLKDARTVVAGKEQTLRIGSGCGAMAKAGSGDVLCGFLAGISAVLKWDLSDSVPLAVWLHGCAGRIASERHGCHSILAGDIANAAGQAIANAAGQKIID